LRGNLIDTQAKKVQPGAQMDQGNFSRHPRSYACRCMQGDCLPYPVSALGCHLMLLTKFSGSVGTVHFKAILAGMGGNEPEVVQKGAAKGNFLVDNRAADASDGQASEDISPNTVITDELWRSRLQQIYCRFGQRCIGDADAG
jgi:hypothetical protein